MVELIPYRDLLIGSVNRAKLANTQGVQVVNFAHNVLVRLDIDGQINLCIGSIPEDSALDYVMIGEKLWDESVNLLLRTWGG